MQGEEGEERRERGKGGGEDEAAEEGGEEDIEGSSFCFFKEGKRIKSFGL